MVIKEERTKGRGTHQRCLNPSPLKSGTLAPITLAVLNATVVREERHPVDLPLDGSPTLGLWRMASRFKPLTPTIRAIVIITMHLLSSRVPRSHLAMGPLRTEPPRPLKVRSRCRPRHWERCSMLRFEFSK